MPKGIEHAPKITARLTAVSMSSNGKQVNCFLMLPVIGGKTVLPQNDLETIQEGMSIRPGDTFSVG